MFATLDKNARRGRISPRAVLDLVALAILVVPAVYWSRSSRAEEGSKAPKATANAKSDGVRGYSEKVEFLPRPSQNEKRILDMLDCHTLMDFHDAPLGDVVAFLRDLHNTTSLQIDTRALENLGISLDTPMTLKVEGIPLRSALGLLLDPYDLTALVYGDVLLITSQDRAESEKITRTYPVGDLLDAQDESSPETLVKALTTTVKSQWWSEVGGPGAIIYVPSTKSILVSQTREVHDALLETLRALRAARDLAGAK